MIVIENDQHSLTWHLGGVMNVVDVVGLSVVEPWKELMSESGEERGK